MPLLKMCVSKIINNTINLDVAVSAAKGIIYLAPAQQHQNTYCGNTGKQPESPINLETKCQGALALKLQNSYAFSM